MRKKLLLLALALVAAASVQAPATATGTHACPQCTTYADGSRCCVACTCNDAGTILACTNHYCPPADGGGV